MKKNSRYSLTIISFAAGLLFFSFPSTAQRYNFTSYSVANGLPNNQINDILQDDFGLLWIGTANGACRFDGINFLKFDQENLLYNNPVKTFYKDRQGNIWIGTIRKGLCRFNGTHFDFFNSSDGLLSDIINAVCEDKMGNIWIGTSEGLNKYDGRKFISYTTSKGLIGNEITSIACDKNGIVWIGSLNGLIKYDGALFTNYSINEGLSNNVILNIFIEKEKSIWLSTYQGATYFDGKTFTNYSTVNGLPNDHIQKIIKDYKENIWFATYGGGIGKLENNKFSALSVNEGLPSNNVTTEMEDREGNLWFGTTNGLSRFSGDRFVIYTTEDGLTNSDILSVYADGKKIWFGTLNTGVNYFENNEIHSINKDNVLKSNTVRCILKDHSGTLWFGTTSGPAKMDSIDLTVSNPILPLNGKIIYSLAEDDAHRIYFGTDNGLFLYDPVKNKIDSVTGFKDFNIRYLYKDKSGVIWAGTLQGAYYLNNTQAISFNEQYAIARNPVTSIIQYRDGTFIFSTYDIGIILFNPGQTGVRTKYINRNNGLNNNRILFSFFDRNDYLWLGTPDGIDRVDWNTYLKRDYLSVNHFDKSNGYFGVETNAAVSDDEGNVWFGTINGAVKYNPRAGSSKNSIPLVSIRNIQLYLNNTDWTKFNYPLNIKTGLPIDPQLNYGNNHLSFYFTGVYLTAPSEVVYRFKLDGFDDYWSPVTKQSIANYPSISPGNFTFLVSASANGKDWSNPIGYSFIIKPPLWRTTLFYIIYGIAAIGLVYLIIFLRTRNLRKSQLLLRKKVNERTIELNNKNLELEKLSIVASETSNAVLIFNKDKELEWVNEGFTRLTGFTIDEIKKNKGKTITELTNNVNLEYILEECITFNKSHSYESQLYSKEGKKLWLSSTLTPVFNKKDELRNIVVIDTDISQRKQMEEQIRGALEERGLLLKEIHHRVKNNLQIIISLFNLQSNYVHDESASKALREGQDRIKSMALIHERFYQSEGLSKIDFDDYIRRLADTLLISSGKNSDRVALNIKSEKISLDIDSAVPCGLIINELVSNSLKHAFKNGSYGKVTIEFGNLNEKEYRLVIKDNGVGFPAGFQYETSDSLGFQLVNALTDQLDGKIAVESNSGVTFTIDFKKTNK